MNTGLNTNPIEAGTVGTELHQAVQCKDLNSGVVGNFLHAGDFRAISPVFNDIVPFYDYLHDHGYESFSSPENPWGVRKKIFKTGAGITIEAGDTITFRETSRLDEPFLRGVVTYKVRFGLVVIIGTNQYELQKLIGIQKV